MPVDGWIAEMDECVRGLGDGTWKVSRITNPGHFAGSGVAVTIYSGDRQFWEKVGPNESIVAAAARAGARARRAILPG